MCVCILMCVCVCVCVRACTQHKKTALDLAMQNRYGVDAGKMEAVVESLAKVGALGEVLGHQLRLARTRIC